MSVNQGDLVNGYKIVRTSSISYVIVYPDSSISVHTENITCINVKGDFIFGRIDPLEPELQRLVTNKRHPGYFIVDTKTHSYQLGLEKEEWLDELKKIGIEQEPSLRRPSSFRNELAPITALRVIIFGQR
ncbi:MAG: hypothetical protein EDM05_65160 [Leptolyngbya sp. IPPAS B-1204]